MMNYNNDKLIAAAFVKARAEIGGTVGKDGQGVYGKYATLAAITDVTSLALSKQGLAIIQEAHLEDGGVTIETTLLHESGATMQFASLTMPLADRKPQAVGSAITYGRRYALAAVCGLAPDDDDGEAAQHAAQPRKVQSSTPTPSKAATPQKSALDGDVLFATDPTPEELAVIKQWSNRTEAEMWSVMIGANADENEARKSLDESIKKCGGKVTKDTYICVYVDFMRRSYAMVAVPA